eukprot:GCRY01002571.1.p1 GENE.GCRY01002571.1~~GCRY01002571.1.p1  ORF type:complete len:1016 (+),score=145.87 GCRY01002571.1:145-3192(+)
MFRRTGPKIKVSATLTVHCVQQLPSAINGKTLFVVWKRGSHKKQVANKGKVEKGFTRVAFAMNGVARWNESFDFNCTFFYTTKEKKKSNSVFDPKIVTFRVDLESEGKKGSGLFSARLDLVSVSLNVGPQVLQIPLNDEGCVLLISVDLTTEADTFEISQMPHLSNKTVNHDDFDTVYDGVSTSDDRSSVSSVHPSIGTRTRYVSSREMHPDYSLNTIRDEEQSDSNILNGEPSIQESENEHNLSDDENVASPQQVKGTILDDGFPTTEIAKVHPYSSLQESTPAPKPVAKVAIPQSLFSPVIRSNLALQKQALGQSTPSLNLEPPSVRKLKKRTHTRSSSMVTPSFKGDSIQGGFVSPPGGNAGYHSRPGSRSSSRHGDARPPINRNFESNSTIRPSPSFTLGASVPVPTQLSAVKERPGKGHRRSLSGSHITSSKEEFARRSPFPTFVNNLLPIEGEHAELDPTRFRSSSQGEVTSQNSNQVISPPSLFLSPRRNTSLLSKHSKEDSLLDRRRYSQSDANAALYHPSSLLSRGNKTTGIHARHHSVSAEASQQNEDDLVVKWLLNNLVVGCRDPQYVENMPLAGVVLFRAVVLWKFGGLEAVRAENNKHPTPPLARRGLALMQHILKVFHEHLPTFPTGNHKQKEGRNWHDFQSERMAIYYLSTLLFISNMVRTNFLNSLSSSNTPAKTPNQTLNSSSSRSSTRSSLHPPPLEPVLSETVMNVQTTPERASYLVENLTELSTENFVAALKTMIQNQYSLLLRQILDELDLYLADAILHQPSPFFATPQQAPAVSPETLASILRRILTCLSGSGLDSGAIETLYAQLFLQIDVKLVNVILSNLFPLTCGRGMSIKMALTELEQWCTHSDHSFVACGSIRKVSKLPLLRQVADVLACNKFALRDEDTRKEICPDINLPHLIHILTLYAPDELDPQPVNPATIASISTRVAASTQSSFDTPQIPLPLLKPFPTAYEGYHSLSSSALTISLSSCAPKLDGDLPPPVLDCLSSLFSSK